MQAGKAIKKNVNKSGTPFALVKYADGTYGVYKLCSNYDGKVRGGIAKTWCYIEKNLTETEATTLYGRRLNGTQR